MDPTVEIDLVTQELDGWTLVDKPTEIPSREQLFRAAVAKLFDNQIEELHKQHPKTIPATNHLNVQRLQRWKIYHDLFHILPMYPVDTSDPLTLKGLMLQSLLQIKRIGHKVLVRCREKDLALVEQLLPDCLAIVRSTPWTYAPKNVTVDKDTFLPADSPGGVEIVEKSLGDVQRTILNIYMNLQDGKERYSRKCESEKDKENHQDKFHSILKYFKVDNKKEYQRILSSVLKYLKVLHDLLDHSNEFDGLIKDILNAIVNSMESVVTKWKKASEDSEDFNKEEALGNITRILETDLFSLAQCDLYV